MIRIDKTKKQKIHSRRINITTYDERYSKIRFVHSRILPISLMRLSGISKLLKKDNWGSGFQPRNKMIAAESRSPKIQYRLFFPDNRVLYFTVCNQQNAGLCFPGATDI